LVRALGLGEIASEIDKQAVDLELKRFRDWRQTDESVKREMAVAIDYGIVEGYPDHTLRPCVHLSRAESAALIYRSCVYRVDAVPTVMVRGEPGLSSTELTPFILKNRSVRRYSLSVIAPDEREVWSYERSRYVHVPLPLVTWLGSTDGGRDVQPGQYLVGGEATDRQGHQFSAVPKPVYVFEPGLSALASPSTARPGDTIQLKAWTRSTAEAVCARPAVPADTGAISLAPSQAPARPPEPRQSQRWLGSYQIPPSATPGEHSLVFEARFDLFGHEVFRDATVVIRVLPSLVLDAEVVPNPARPGSTIVLGAGTSPTADCVTARLLGQNLDMSSQTGGSSWTATLELVGVQPGTYPVRFTAHWGNERKHTTVPLVVRQLDARDLVYLLVD